MCYSALCIFTRVVCSVMVFRCIGLFQDVWSAFVFTQVYFARRNIFYFDHWKFVLESRWFNFALPYSNIINLIRIKLYLQFLSTRLYKNSTAPLTEHYRNRTSKWNEDAISASRNSLDSAEFFWTDSTIFQKDSIFLKVKKRTMSSKEKCVWWSINDGRFIRTYYKTHSECDSELWIRNIWHVWRRWHDSCTFLIDQVLLTVSYDAAC